MRTVLYAMAIAITVTVSSCSDWLEIKPKGKIIPNTVADYQLLMDQATDRGSSDGWVMTYGNDLFITDDVYISDDNYLSKYGDATRNAYIWADHIYLEEQEDPDWNTMYNQIYVANTVISEVLSASGDENLKKQLYAEARVQRAYSYWVLVNLYAKQYNESTAASDLGVPLLTKPSLTGAIPRASVKAVYDLILSDLKESVASLPDLTTKNYRATNASAYALLSRVYLYMGNYSGASENAAKSLELYDFMYDYNTLPKNSYYTTMLKFPENYLNKELLLNKEPNNSYSLIYPSEALTNSYDTDNDFRYAGMYYLEWFPPLTNKLYMIEYTTGRVYGPSVSEMMLIQAECYARAGSVTEAVDKVNYIRKFRISKTAYAPVSATSKEEALELVKKERRIELAFKGLRWFDLKRYNAYDNANITLKRTISGKEYTLAPNSNRWVLPIARKYILKNPEIEQNPR